MYQRFYPPQNWYTFAPITGTFSRHFTQHQIQLLEGFAYGNSFAQIRKDLYNGRIRLDINNVSLRIQGLTPSIIDAYVNFIYNSTYGEIEGNVAAENSGIEGLRENLSEIGITFIHLGDLDNTTIIN